MAGLDPITAAEIGKLIVEQQKQRNITSVVVTHEIHSARIFADRFVLMNEGKILADGAFDDLRKSRNTFCGRILEGGRLRRKAMSRAFRLGVFIVGTLVIFAAGVFFVGSNESLFRSTYRLKAQFQNVSGLINGADVRVGGIHKGTVRSIQLPHRPDEKLTVMMDLENSTRDVIKKDSVASIKSEGLFRRQIRRNLVWIAGCR